MPPMRIKIGERWVGDGEPCYIVAEAGSNHNASFEQALRLIDVASEAGADAVKFQHFKAAKLYPQSAGKSVYLKTPRSIYEIIREMEMPDEWIPRLAEYCCTQGIAFLSTPFDEQSADLLEPYVPAYKVASYEMTHVPLLRHLARKGKPLIISTGTAMLDEVLHAVDVVLKEGNREIVLLQCTASYPTPLEAMNVRALVTIRQATGCLTGLSDHSSDPIIAPIAAAALGACVIEKHFTLSNRLPGPDHQFAVEPQGLRELVRCVRAVEKVLGHGRKETLPVEAELHSFARRSIFAVRDISPGELITRENIAVLRCGKLGFGLHPDHYDALLNRRAVRLIRKESVITFEDVQ